jgi:hypothetical protein
MRAQRLILTMAEADVKKRRNANFSANDCVLLANITGQSSSLNENLTNYQYFKFRHKFNSSKYFANITMKSYILQMAGV